MAQNNPFANPDTHAGTPDSQNDASAGALARIHEELNTGGKAATGQYTESPTSLVTQATEKTTARQASDEPPTNYVNQAAEQNRDVVVQNVQGLSKWFEEDFETNLMKNVEQAMARANLVLDMAPGGKGGIALGTVGELAGWPKPGEYWHSSNDKTNVGDFVSKAEKAYTLDPKTMVAGLGALEQRIDANLLDEHTGAPLGNDQRDRIRQMAENAAMIKLGVAQVVNKNNPDSAAALISGPGHSVEDLIKIAKAHGGNSANLDQIAKLAKEVAPAK